MEWEVCVDEIRLEFASELLGMLLDESGTDEAECSRKVTSGRRVAGVIMSLVNAKSMQIECAEWRGGIGV